MARPKQDGLLYFSFDTDFFYADKRIKRVKARLGNNGLLFYIYLLTEIYRNGYYIRWDEESIDNAIDDLNLTEGFIEQAMICLTARELITKIEIIDSRQCKTAVITSPGIQKRYQEAVKGRKRQIEVDAEIWLLKKEETASCINVAHNVSFSEKNQSKSEKNQSKSEKNSIKESKVKEIKIKKKKGNKIKISSSCEELGTQHNIQEDKSKKETERQMIERVLKEYHISKDLLESVKDWIEYKRERRFQYKEMGLKSLLKQITENAKKYSEEAVRNIILDSMANGYQGIIFDKLRKNDISGGTRRDQGGTYNNINESRQSQLDYLLNSIKEDEANGGK